MNMLKRIISNLKWAAYGQADYINPTWASIIDYVIETKTGDYIHVKTGKRKPADSRSINAVKYSFWTVKPVDRNWFGRKK